MNPWSPSLSRGGPGRGWGLFRGPHPPPNLPLEGGGIIFCDRMRDVKSEAQACPHPNLPRQAGEGTTSVPPPSRSGGGLGRGQNDLIASEQSFPPHASRLTPHPDVQACPHPNLPPQAGEGTTSALPPLRSGGGLGRGQNDLIASEQSFPPHALRLTPHAPEATPHTSRLTPHPNSPGAVRRRLGARRWHFQHGPIDLIIGADGDIDAVEAAVARAWSRFQFVLQQLVTELPLLRSPVQDVGVVTGPVARRMVSACAPHSAEFITPMAAVAGSVADELIEFFRSDPYIARAYVNNGGDIALHLTPGQSYGIGVYADLARVKRREPFQLDGELTIAADLPVRGVATSGWRGRSFSLGIADSVTVLADCAATADAAATIVANCVNTDDPAILRQPACVLKDDSDLGTRLVTVSVGRLSEQRVEQALASGARRAEALIARGLIHCAALWLQGRARLVGC